MKSNVVNDTTRGSEHRQHSDTFVQRHDNHEKLMVRLASDCAGRGRPTQPQLLHGAAANEAAQIGEKLELPF